ncbi:MAG TPA: CvpA family protein [Dokdonella sp.]|uniref:CvpA family protein n=1 Tax=Dokdonella sp. TaxID=2291710 RepID=UPI0025C2D6B0|nr:CvpA family protein [Dokdonella sp.]MBX3692461.1 CvpA family protein [Dokdonella sp.]MCW5569134.1 CvpA family protein [Dokdonella sp.]HNR91219.1 CvpA family protein [Dokdonella sp.]
MTWFDYAIAGVLALSVLIGLWRGFIGEVLALACWVLAFWVAWMFGPLLAERFSAISVPSVRVMLAYGLCFVAVLMAGALVSFLLRKLVSGSGLSGTDRLLGMVFGLVRGAAVVVLVVMLMKFTPVVRDDWWQASQLRPTFEEGAHWVTSRLPEEVSRYLQPAEAMPVDLPDNAPAGEPPGPANPTSTVD